MPAPLVPLEVFFTRQQKKRRVPMPCHASTYDPVTGTAIGGPASVQPAPSNVLPRLDMESDSNGFLYILPPTWGVNDNGIVGYGRFLAN